MRHGFRSRRTPTILEEFVRITQGNRECLLKRVGAKWEIVYDGWLVDYPVFTKIEVPVPMCNTFWTNVQ